MARMSKEKSWLWEFSKKVVWIITLLFVAVFLFCCGVIIFYPDSTAVQFIIENISDVFKVTVVSYAVKAGFENITKIRRNPNVELFDSECRADNSDSSGITRCD